MARTEKDLSEEDLKRVQQYLNSSIHKYERKPIRPFLLFLFILAVISIITAIIFVMYSDVNI